MQDKIGDTAQEYLRRINLVLDFVEKNLDKDLSLEQLSEKAFYSSFHFHRIFATAVGETLNSFINRKRIERIASILLVGTNEPIKELAYKYGFNSDSSFSRAFKKYYGISATEFKVKGKNIVSKIGIELVTPEKYFCRIDKIKNWIDMNAKIEVKELQEIRLAAMTHIGEFDQIGATYEKLFSWAGRKGLLNTNNVKAVTVYHDNPQVTPMTKVRLSACLTIEKNFSGDGDVRQVMIQRGHYATGHFEISPELFPKAWDSMCIWVVENGYEFQDGDYFEIYHNDGKTHPEHKFIIDICIPVKKKSSKNTVFNIDKRRTNYIKLEYYKEEIEKGHIQKDYNFLITYIKALRNHFLKEYLASYKVGSIYQGNMNYTYFPFTPASLKIQKLKIVIIFNHVQMRFEICLAGQNRQVQKKYWEMFKGSDWNKYRIPESVNEGFSIAEHILIEKPDFENLDLLTKQIDEETLRFTQDIIDVLD